MLRDIKVVMNFIEIKSETSNFGDAFQQNSGNVFGTTFDSHTADLSRYEPGLRRTNELPFSQERTCCSNRSIKAIFQRSW